MKDGRDVERTLEKKFSSWFKKHVCLFYIFIFCKSEVAGVILLIVTPIASTNSLKHFLLPDQVARLCYVEGEDINDELYALSCEPDLRVRILSACLVDGVRFHTIEREKNRTQNSGIMTEGTHNGENLDFYGCLKEIIELRYNSGATDRRTVVIFRCDWFDTYTKKVRMKDDGFFRSINHGSC
jgi:hypothetical protein